MLSLDILNVDSLQKRFLPFIVSEKGKDLMIDRNTYDKTTGRFYNKRIVIRNGIRKDKQFFIQLYNWKEMSALLRKAGFKTVRFFGDWDSKPLTNDSRRMIVVAKKGDR